MLRTRFFAWHKISSIIYDFLVVLVGKSNIIRDGYRKRYPSLIMSVSILLNALNAFNALIYYR